jgi:hypothetical protein
LAEIAVIESIIRDFRQSVGEISKLIPCNRELSLSQQGAILNHSILLATSSQLFVAQ